ncbi:MAG: hypothetical protein K5668_08305 [Lachnospiraceae bacterium]|nr:hypothetical protein [Lachnospiraceae bacterium]
MKDNEYTLFIKKFKEGHDINTALSDEDMERATGGVGGANEATCPQCGKPMKVVNNSYGDNYWTCESCAIDQFFSDAEYIEVLKAAEAAGQTQGLVYPVWWKQVNH